MHLGARLGRKLRTSSVTISLPEFVLQLRASAKGVSAEKTVDAFQYASMPLHSEQDVSRVDLKELVAKNIHDSCDNFPKNRRTLSETV